MIDKSIRYTEMKRQVNQLIEKLKAENQSTSESMHTKSEYGHTVAVHTYNTKIEIIKQLVAIGSI